LIATLKLLDTPGDLVLVNKTNKIFEILDLLELSLDLWQAQNIYFRVFQKKFKNSEAKKDKPTKELSDAFTLLGENLKIECA